MAINFPSSPNPGDIYTYNGYIWEYVSGGYWKSVTETDYIYSATTSGTGTSVIADISGGNLYLKSFSGNNISISESNGVLTFSAGSTSTSGDYLPLSGGTVTGGTTFQSGLTANTISATTYYNLPVSAVTNGTGISASTSNGTVTITNTSPNQPVTISGGTGITTGGTYPNFTLLNSDLGSSQNIFKNIQIGEVTQFSAGSNSANLNFSGINMTITSAATNTLVFSASTGGAGAVSSVTAVSGLSGNSTTGAITLVNTGVTGITAGYGISASTSTGSVTIIQQFDYGKSYTTGNNLNFI